MEWAACGALYTVVACLTGCACLYSCVYNAKMMMRYQFLLKDEAVTTRLVHCCCEPYALCQDYRELQHRTFDMVVGCHGNVVQRKRKLVLTTATVLAIEPAMRGGARI
ncbi:hypothetical protein K1719_002135 [Acacia pycnantha]|nr:hypothetical protein K1719_002135 [Acacia pycnantha]